MIKGFLTICITSVCLLMSEGVYAQQQDVVNYGYDRDTILNDWISWSQYQDSALSFVPVFMLQYSVPQQPVGPLDLHKTWLWWISNHPTEIAAYLAMKAAQQ